MLLSAVQQSVLCLWVAPGFADASLGLLLGALLPEVLRAPVLAVLWGGRWLAAKMLTRCRRRS